MLGVVLHHDVGGRLLLSLLDHRIMGDPSALVRALQLVSKQIRDNPSKERPGGATPQLLSIIQGDPLPCLMSEPYFLPHWLPQALIEGMHLDCMSTRV